MTEIAAADSRIRIIDHTMTSAELTGLLATCDCYVSLHRSEGFGYGPADAMGLGKPVITTAYSGVTDFCTSETALPIDYVLDQVPQGAYPYMDAARQYYWASPDIDAAAFQMRRLYENPEIGVRLGRTGTAIDTRTLQRGGAAAPVRGTSGRVGLAIGESHADTPAGRTFRIRLQPGDRQQESRPGPVRDGRRDSPSPAR